MIPYAWLDGVNFCILQKYPRRVPSNYIRHPMFPECNCNSSSARI